MAIDPDSVVIRDIEIGDAGWLIQRHAELYHESEGFDASFEPLVAEILSDFLRNRDPKTERAFIAVSGETRLGSIFCVQSGTPGVAKLRLFLIDVPSARPGPGAPPAEGLPGLCTGLWLPAHAAMDTRKPPCGLRAL